MSRAKPKVEALLPALIEKPSVPAAVGQALERLVEQKVQEEIAHRENAIWQPYYQNRRVTREWKRHQSVREKQKWAILYERWGCEICKTRDRPHGALGKCHLCYLRTSQRLEAILSERRPYSVRADPSRAERDQRIIERRRAGATWKQIGEELGLNRTTVRDAAKKVQQRGAK